MLLLPLFGISTATVIALWLAREVGARIIDHSAARVGQVGYIREDSTLTETVVGPDGERWRSSYVPREGGPRELRYLVTGHLYNDADTALLLRDPKVVFWAEDGPRIRYVNPKLQVAGSLTSVVTVPAHGEVEIRIELSVPAENLGSTFADAIPILELDTTSGKVYRFALSTTIWRLGKDVVAWDGRRNRVVRAGTKQWMRARLKHSLGSTESRALRK